MDKTGGFWHLIIVLSILAIVLHVFEPSLPIHLLIVTTILVTIYAVKETLEKERHYMEIVVTALMAIVGLLTFSLGLHVEGNMVLGLFGLAEVLEEYAEERAERSLRSLITYLPRKAKVLSNSSILEVDVKDVKSGDIVVVGRGDRIPVDGVVVREKEK